MKKKNINGRIKQFTPLLVKWKDPCAYYGWKNLEDWLQLTVQNKDHVVGMECTSCGFFAYKNKDGLGLCLNRADTAVGDIGMIFEIPRGVITEIWEFE